MDDAAASDLAAVIYLDARIEHRALAHLAAVADVCLGIYLGPGANHGPGADICERADVCIVGNLDPGSDERRLLDAALVDSGHLGDHVEQMGNGGIRVVDTYHRGLDGMLGHEVATHQHHRRRGVIDVMGVFGICQKRQGAGVPLLDLGEGADGDVGIALDIAAYHCSKL